MAHRGPWLNHGKTIVALLEPNVGPSCLRRRAVAISWRQHSPSKKTARNFSDARRLCATQAPSRPTSSGPAHSSSDSSSSFSSSSSSSSSSSQATRPRRPRLLLTLLTTLAWLPILIFIDDHVISIAIVSGGSMTPTLNPLYTTHGISAPRDVVLLDRATADLDEWDVGDVVSLVSPRDPNVLLTKRILALPGDVVRWVDPERNRGANGGKVVWSRVRIPPGHCWVEGDSSVFAKARGTRGGAGGGGGGEASTHSSAYRKMAAAATTQEAVQHQGTHTPYIDTSQDSRHFGPIPLALLTARVSHILYPFHRLGPLTRCRPDGSCPAARPGQAGGSGDGYWPWEWDWGRMWGFKEGEERRERRGKELEKMRWRRAREDSRLTPYAVREEEGHEGGEDDVESTKGKTGSTSSSSSSSSSSPRQDDEAMRRAYNALSRGGQLGEAAAVEAKERSLR